MNKKFLYIITILFSFNFLPGMLLQQQKKSMCSMIKDVCEIIANIKNLEINFYCYKSLGYSTSDIQIFETCLNLVKKGYNVPGIKKQLTFIELQKQGYSSFQINSWDFFKKKFDQAYDYVEKKEYQKAAPILQKLDEIFDDPQIQFLLANLYFTISDFVKAHHYATKALRNNHKKSNFLNKMIKSCTLHLLATQD